MHEMSLAAGVLQVLEDSAKAQGFTRVRTVWLEIGQLAAVDAEALRFCFDAVTHGSLAEGCQLEIVATPGSGRCMQCGASVPLPALYAACPQCGGYRVEATGGTAMRVKELEVD